MSAIRDIATIARWEVKKTFSVMSKNVLPVAILLFVLLIFVTGFAAQSGLHIQDGMYRIGIDDPKVAALFTPDARFTVYQAGDPALAADRDAYDLVIVKGVVYASPTEKGRSAQNALARDYTQYKNSVYAGESDLFAAYPLWIDTQSVESELNFTATQNGQFVQVAPGRGTPVPQGPVENVPTPSPTLGVSQDELRQEVTATSQENTAVSRYTDVLSPGQAVMGSFVTPDQLSPPLPFDSIILVFVFIFPLYFTSQFFMMSIMNERIERQGEPLLSLPVRTSSIILGKMLPYFLGMLAICAGITLYIKASPLVLLPLVPIIVFFLANALVIGMLARSFRELSFISIFFSTVATSYLFFPSIFANVHVISLVSPLTLIVLTIQGTAWTAADYVYATALFWLTAGILFALAAKNFNEERLFSEKKLLPRVREFLSSILPQEHPYVALFVLAVLSIPFVFMAQMMGLVVFFNLPMPYSLVLLLVLAAFIEEMAKAAGIYTLFMRDPAFFSWKHLVPACAATAIGFLVGEKLLLFATLAQITQSVFGSVLFLSLGVLWMPLLLHFACVLMVACSLRLGGRRWFVPALVAATVIHCCYNLYFILGWPR
ncbi:PrsW family intramembrane metalloprotease [Methanoregula sp.]|uniref:ABC transporter permease n=1 Tax=Methanoregula sp. TaxID=2052170 RepID=UPI002CA4610F|nr:PrsW family intramembrane metalloprotease [Methanoregula sp.]HVP96302.1 PrsW family intramembrane metalloprotease [Methanoregula sp.]